MTAVIDAWFDFGCPFSMLTRRLLAAEFGDFGPAVRWYPHEAPGGARNRLPAARVWERGVRPLADRLGVPVHREPPPPAPTRLALQGYHYAVDRGRGSAYSDQVFDAYFRERLDIADPGVLAGAAGRAGLDPERFLAAVDSPRYAQRHRTAVARWPSVRTTPTVVSGGYRVEGVPNAVQLARIVALSGRRPPEPARRVMAGAAAPGTAPCRVAETPP
ncbi:DsbA family protein [Streptomyces sp. NPDC058861]|uniref:DsbA family oxidoreductase n=1 Tax=Streptomyces sp. NPDC058861 TaxID=3346653 RepID=UPI0036B4B87B